MAHDLIATAVRLAEEAPQRRAVRCADSGVGRTRGEVIAEARRLGALLDARCPGKNTILIQGPPGAGFHAALLAVWGTGRRALPIGTLTEEDLATLREAHRPAAILSTEPGPTPHHAADPTRFVTTFEDGDGLAALDRGAEASLLLQSSGTVGRPRVALRSGKAIDRVAATLLGTIGIDEHDRILSALPMHHAYGIEHAVMLPILAGAEVIQMPTLRIDIASELLVDDATILPAVPPTIESLARAPIAGSSLRLAYTAGSPLPTATRERFESAWDIPVGDLYGATEVGTITWGLGGSSRPVAGVEVRTAEDGELMVRSDAMFTGYLDRHDEPPSTERIRDGWFLTGDLARIEPPDDVRLIGRARLQFDVGGLKVNPNDVEDVLREHPEVAEVMVAPLPLSDTVNRVHARIVPTADAAPDPKTLIASINAHARGQLPPHQVPRRIQLVEALPRTASGKLIRSQAAPIDS